MVYWFRLSDFVREVRHLGLGLRSAESGFKNRSAVSDSGDFWALGGD